MIFSFLTQRMKHGVYIITAGYILSLILCVPSWGFYNRNKLTWLKHKEENKTIKEKTE